MRGSLLLLALAAAISAGAVPENLTVSGTVIYSQAWNLFFLKTETENLFVATRQGHADEVFRCRRRSTSYGKRHALSRTSSFPFFGFRCQKSSMLTNE